MSNLQDTFDLDPDNQEFNQALEVIQHTNRLVYLTGKAGTGKTTFLKYLRATSSKNVVVLAPTGVAAINAGGQTIHSFFQIRPSLYAKDDKRLRERADVADPDRSTIYNHFQYRSDKLELIRGLDLLVIDEVSMVRCDLLDVVDRLLRVFRQKRTLPFGGVQTLLIGDAFQLPPVANAEDLNILGQSGYLNPFFFGSAVLEANKPIFIELKKIYRQKEEEFIALLNRVRVNEVDDAEMLALNGRLDPGFEPTPDQGYIILGTHNHQVDIINEVKLQKLPKPEFEYVADVKGEFPGKIYPADEILKLRVGAQVMFLKNDKNARVYNGAIGRLTTLEPTRIEVTLPDDRTIWVQRYVWKNIRYIWDKRTRRVREEELGTFTQYPLRLAWAITVHKSQGLTFERVIADIGAAFAPGQVYVALSRCTSFNGLVLSSRINRSAIKTDRDVLRFAKEGTPETLIVAELNSGKADGHYQEARTAFQAGRFLSAYEEVMRALRYRNDIETSYFKRYVDVHCRRLARWRDRLGTLQAAEEHVLDLQADISSLVEANEQLSQDHDRVVHRGAILDERISELEDALAKTEADLKETKRKKLDAGAKAMSLDLKVQQKEALLELAAVELKSERASLHRSQYEATRQSSLLSAESAKIKALEEEIKRLKGLSWLDKLLGAR